MEQSPTTLHPVKLKQNLSSIQEEDSFENESVYYSPEQSQVHSFYSAIEPPTPHPEQPLDAMFKIRNLDTGEEIDIRDENKETFAQNVIKLLNIQNSQVQLEEYYKLKRGMNNLLWESVERNDIQGIKRVLDRREYGDLAAQTNAKGLNDWTALHIASVDGFIEAVKILISHGEETDIDAKTSINRTPLHLACLHGYLEVVKVLVSKGANINSVDDDCNSCLHYASMHGHIDIVKWLLSRIPDIYLKNWVEKTCVDVAANIEIFKSIAEHCEKYELRLPKSPYSRTPFYNSILHNSRTDIINKILVKGLRPPSSRDLQTFFERPKKVPLKKTVKLKEESIFLPPSKIGPHDFKGLVQLGKGSFGEVYLVEKIDTGELFALKVLQKDKVMGNNLVRYAFTERNILMNIDHPYIVKLNYSFQTPEKLALVMDFCPNGDLGTHLAREKRFPEEKARFYIVEILLALEDLHKHGIIFRDLKPENVVLDEAGHARLTDFGLSKEGIAENQVSRSFCGSVAYLAPEMLRRSGHTRSVDWYLLGVLLYEMLVGSPPYYSANREQLFNNILRGKLRVPPFMSDSSKDLIKELLHRDPQKRLGATKKDSEELKSHEFFEEVDWQAFLNKQVEAPYIKEIRRGTKDIPLERIFGVLETPIQPNQLDGWSFMNGVKKEMANLNTQ